VDVALLILALLGHVLLWVDFVNRIHGMAWPAWLISSLMLAGMVCVVLVPVAYVLWLPSAGLALGPGSGLEAVLGSGLPYLVICWIAALVNIAAWTWYHVLHRPPDVLLRQHTRRAKFLAPADADGSPDHRHHRLVYLPRNEILDMELTERHLEVPHLDPALDGLTIIHLSDLHLTGRVGKAFFRQVVHWTNELGQDLVAITGDVVDNSQCIDWIPDTLGRLRAPCGVYFVLGNHDVRADFRRIHRALVDCGLIALGGRWIEVPVGETSVVLAGNELPWIPPAADMRGAPGAAIEEGPLRILLSHSPDQLPWARHHRFDLMLAGHTHGGQICFPLIGPILTPSRVGVRYASGVFHDPPTIMHVSRGVSGEFPVRWLCRPEINKLVLCAGGEADRR